MLEPGTVKAGDELVYDFGDTPACKMIVKVARITNENDVIVIGSTLYREGIIVLENGGFFRPDGTTFSARNDKIEDDAFHPFTPELHPLTPELRKEIQQKGQYMIHKLDSGFAISSNGVWLPGCYNSERAAKYAFKFSDEELRLLQNEVNAKEHDIAKRVISFEMLQELKKSMEG